MTDGKLKIARFFELALNAKHADDELRAEFSDVEYESVLDHVLANPELRSDFAGAFVEIAYDPSLGPIDLVEYCMHCLRWEEVEAHFLDRLEAERSERGPHCDACSGHSTRIGRNQISIAGFKRLRTIRQQTKLSSFSRHARLTA